ncbi:MAG: hypothetical protein IPK82_38580 [Polyangiaceae bacterium]|nr:hypothetical protein [Polyangiaceae bacterium]
MAVPLQAGVDFSLDWPSAAREIPENALPVIDVSAVPGAAVLFRRGGEGRWSRTRRMRVGTERSLGPGH